MKRNFILAVSLALMVYGVSAFAEDTPHKASGEHHAHHWAPGERPKEVNDKFCVNKNEGDKCGPTVLTKFGHPPTGVCKKSHSAKLFCRPQPPGSLDPKFEKNAH